jgi:RNA polymerase sigma-70 factor (ECF subfamily)
VRDSLRVQNEAGPAASDEQLLAAVADGSRAALRELYERHAPWLLIRLRRRCADPTIVADTVQDTFVAVWRSASSYQGSGTVAAWIWGIGVRRMIGQFRSSSTKATLPLFDDDLHAVAANESSGLLASAEELVLERVEHGDLAGAINRLSPELRAVVQATVLDGLTTREAGHLLGIPAGTVKTRMMRAKRELRAALA